ncbi:MAG: LA_1612 family putative O-antigen biosynthesis protein [Syntrophorhabdaceae bacterium]
MKFSSVPKAIAYLIKSKKVWRKPGKADVLIVDRSGSEVLLTYLDPRKVGILDLGGESLNFFVFFKCLLNNGLWFTAMDYMVQYVKCVEPRVALTFIDNNHLFYRLKNHQKNLTTVFVQNGIRGDAVDVFSILKKQKPLRDGNRVDYMLTFGNAVGREYATYIDGKIIPIGSLKNNFFQSKTRLQPKTVLFLSQYRYSRSPTRRPMAIYGDKSIFWDEFYAVERFLLPLLHRYCRENGLVLKICGCSSAQADEERNYFRSLLGNDDLQFLENENLMDGYEQVTAAGFVVFIESTLGYEALARGKKTAVFSMRGKLWDEADRDFGWPATLPENGPFWTHRADEREFSRVMDYITTVENEEWERIRQRYIPELMEYDPGNTRFLSLMRELGVPLKDAYLADAQRSVNVF